MTYQTMIDLTNGAAIEVIAEYTMFEGEPIIDRVEQVGIGNEVFLDKSDEAKLFDAIMRAEH